MIKVLEKSVADKIAAGEVIERPISVVKELVENAIDAGSTSIQVELRNGGKSYLRVTDNGCGIPAEEVETAFLRHATSKVSSVQDLSAIDTLGFRGEALASIGAVTRTEILTKCPSAKLGKQVILHGGEILTSKQTGCPDGTTVVVTDLFYNTPARLKFLKNDGAESSLIIEFISQMALAYKDIRFRLINNGKTLFHTAGDGNRFNTIVRVYPQVDPHSLTPVNYQEGSLHLEGYISTPAFSKASRSNQIFFVNGRVVRSKVMEKGLAEGYRERLFEDRHPVAYLFLETDPADLDVNIHPNKREVRFDHEREITLFISRAIQQALGTKEGMVSGASLFRENQAQYQTQRKDEEQVNVKTLLSIMQNTPQEETAAPTQTTVESKPGDGSLSDIPASIRKIRLPKFDAVKQDAASSAIAITEPAADDVARFAEPEPTPASPPASAQPEIRIDAPAIRPFDFDALTVTGVIFDTYITATDENSFYLIDQHAAHERVFYEKLVGQYLQEEKLRQPILTPLMLQTDAAAAQCGEEWLEILTRMGFSIDEFGQNTYRVSEIPTLMTLGEAEDFLHDFLDHLKDGTIRDNTTVINKLIMKSCKAAVKAHDVLSPAEIEALLQDLRQCKNPFSCPHGRPTFVRFSQRDIERLFKRIQ